MKARTSVVPLEMERYIRDSIKQQIKLESGYVTEAIACVSLLTLSEEPYNFGRKRLEDFYERLHHLLMDLSKRYDDDWPDMVVGMLREKGVETIDDGWIAERQWFIDKSKPREAAPVVPLQLHGELERFRKALEGK